MKFEHKSIEITLTDKGDFTARIAGKTHRAASLDAMKKRIDTHTAEAFEAFDAFREREYRDPEGASLFPVRIVAFQKAGRGRHDRPLWVTDTGATHARVLPNTPEAVAAYETWQRAAVEWKEARERLEKAERSTRDAIPFKMAREAQ